MSKYKTIIKSAGHFANGRISKTVCKIASKHGSKILTGLGISGFITSIIWSGKIAPKTKEEIDSVKEELNVDKLHPVDTIKIVGKNYIPVIFLAVASTGCVVGAQIFDYKKYSALAAMYTLSESTLREYMAKTIEEFGQDKVDDIKNKMVLNQNNDQIEEINPDIVYTGSGSMVCYEPISDKYFYSTTDKIRNVFNELNYRINKGDDVYPNDVLYELNILNGNLLFGDSFVWNLDTTGLIDYRFGSKLKDGKTPCLTINYGPVLPKYCG